MGRSRGEKEGGKGTGGARLGSRLELRFPGPHTEGSPEEGCNACVARVSAVAASRIDGEQAHACKETCMALFSKKSAMTTREGALPGRSNPLKVPELHFVTGHRIKPPFPAGLKEAVFGLGCFWGAERIFWQLPGVYSTAVGYAGGFTPNPTYQEVCTGETGHTEVVRVIYDP